MDKKIIGVGIFIVIIVIGIFVSSSINSGSKNRTHVVHGAVGGGKENFLNDEDVIRILKEKYKLELQYDDWSNNKLIKDPLTYQEGRAQVNYDFAFFSDERFYEYYKTPAKEGETARLPILKSAISLNTPIVIYSWGEIAEALKNDGIVEQRDDSFFIKDMPRLLSYISEGKKWTDIGVNDVYGKINIASTDPVTSSPGATYYGLLASIMNEGYVDSGNIEDVMPKLESFYLLSGFMNNTPADLFDLYLRMGRGAYPLVVDYEKSIMDFSYKNPQGFEQVKNKIKILYPEPTIWNSHCIVSFSDAGSTFMDALEDQEIKDIAWKKYGFRTGILSSSELSEEIKTLGIQQEVTSVTQGLRKDIYDRIVSGLKDSLE